VVNGGRGGKERARRRPAAPPRTANATAGAGPGYWSEMYASSVRIRISWECALAFTRSPMDSTPRMVSPSITGRWRMRFSVMMVMASSTVLSGVR
jgi:hypothetical protein